MRGSQGRQGGGGGHACRGHVLESASESLFAFNDAKFLTANPVFIENWH